MASAADRMSALSDRVLRRVLSFLPTGDAAGASLISRRWRALWLQANAIYLDADSYTHVGYDGKRAGRLLFDDAMAAVSAGGRCLVKKLSIHVYSDYHMDYCEDIMRTSPGMDAVLAVPAMQHLEELSVDLLAEFSCTCDYELPTCRLPCGSLRVLELTGCKLGPPSAMALFGRLDTLSLTSCSSSLETLQAMFDSTPNLATLRLDSFFLKAEEELGCTWYQVMSKRRILLRCPRSMAAVTLMHCHWTSGLYLDAPNVRFLRYKGYLQHFPFTPATPSGVPANLQHIELSFCTARRCFNNPSSKAQPHAAFWESIGSFRCLRFLKVKLQDMNNIAVHLEQEDRYLKEFPDLKFLEVEGSYEVDKHGAAVALANFLHCCPTLQELRLKFKKHGDLHAFPNRFHLSGERRAQLELEKSIELLTRLKSGTSTSPFDSIDVDDVDLSALRRRSFPCLESHLRKIKLKFVFVGFSCFEVKIAKFLVENAIVLEEMEIHDGDQRVNDHIHHKLAIWRANSSNSKIDIVGEQEPRMLPRM